MKKTLGIVFVMLLFVSILAACGGKEITLHLSYGDRTGKYSGDMTDGVPNGQGKFTAKNEEGVEWTYEGSFVNGHFQGEGKTTWKSGQVEIGTYEDDVIVPLKDEQLRTFYSNTEEFLHHCVELVGQVFTSPENDENGVAVQFYTDIENHDKNTIVYIPATDFEVKQGDYIHIIGLVDSEVDGVNILGGGITAPLVIAREYEVISYIDAVSPTKETIDVNKTLSQYDYSITVEKVELAEKETRVYISIQNSGTDVFHMYSFNAVLSQNGKQLSEEYNYEADYPAFESDLHVGNSTEGIITFPPIENQPFTLILDAGSDNFNERIKPFEFSYPVTEEKDEIPAYTTVDVNQTQTQYNYSIVINKVELDENETRVYVTVQNDGTDVFHLYPFNAKISQDGKQYNELVNWEEGYDSIESDLLVGNTTDGIIVFDAISDSKPFTLRLEAFSDNFSEILNPYEFTIELGIE